MRLAARDLAVVAALVVLAGLRLGPAVATTAFHRDEARWLHNAQLLRAWRHPLGDAWQDEGYPVTHGTIDETTRRRGQPPLAMYVLGLGVRLQTGRLPTNGYWIMTENTRWNTAHGNRPKAAELTAGRRTNVAVALLTVVAVYALGRLLGNRVGAAAGAGLYAIHPLVRSTSTRAWADPVLVLLVAAAALAAAAFARRPTVLRALVLGVLLGLGGATKLSPLATAVLVGIAGIAVLAWALLRGECRGRRLRLGLGYAIAPLVAFVVFVAGYPYLWPDPIAHTRRMVDFRADSFVAQAENAPGARVEDRADALRRVGRELGERASAAGQLGTWLEGLVGGRWGWTHGLDLGLAIAGWLLLVTAVGQHGVGWPPVAAAGVLVGQAAAVVGAMGVEYARYLLPVLLAVAVGAGYAVGCVWAWARHAVPLSSFRLAAGGWRLAAGGRQGLGGSR